MKLQHNVTLTLFLICFGSIHAQTTLSKNGAKWDLLVDGKTFEVKGVTFGYEKDVDNYPAYFKDLKFLGVNTIRLWGNQ